MVWLDLLEKKMGDYSKSLFVQLLCCLYSALSQHHINRWNCLSSSYIPFKFISQPATMNDWSARQEIITLDIQYQQVFMECPALSPSSASQKLAWSIIKLFHCSELWDTIWDLFKHKKQVQIANQWKRVNQTIQKPAPTTKIGCYFVILWSLLLIQQLQIIMLQRTRKKVSLF